MTSRRAIGISHVRAEERPVKRGNKLMARRKRSCVTSSALAGSARNPAPHITWYGLDKLLEGRTVALVRC